MTVIIEELKRIRNYFGEHDKTPFEHHAYNFLNDLMEREKASQLEPLVIPQKQGITSEGINMKNYPIHKPLKFKNTIKPLWIAILVISIIFFGISLAMFLSV